MSDKEDLVKKLMIENSILKELVQKGMSGEKIQREERFGPNDAEEVKARITQQIEDGTELTKGVLRNKFRSTRDDVFEDALLFLCTNGYVKESLRANAKNRTVSYLYKLRDYSEV